MRNKFAILTEAFAEGKYISLDREPLDEFDLSGFIVGLSDKLLLLHVVGGSDLRLNGYEVVRIKDIKGVAIDNNFIDRYLRLKGVTPTALPDVDLAGMPFLLFTLAPQYSLLMIYCEAANPHSGDIGQVEEVTMRKLRLRTVDTNAFWDTLETIKLCDITRVTFDDGYIQALEWMVERDDQEWLAEHEGEAVPTV